MNLNNYFKKESPLLNMLGMGGGVGSSLLSRVAGITVDELFSTKLYSGNGGTQTITNGIDLSGEGGIVWNKSRNGTANHFIFDPALGSGAYLQPNTTAVLATGANYSFTSTGLTDAYNNYSHNEAVCWTFRKAPRFFPCLTETGNTGAN